ncbi:MAG: ABC transporter substrate-binding protein [Oscillospiraceae bacterium]|jgi:peptide/nickel transport system substrate-binding protein|nr:ABC transporter substrate-binding protein [Oscillospiraceae bacterium]
MKRVFQIFILILLSALVLSGCFLESIPMYIPPMAPRQHEFDDPPEFPDLTPSVVGPAHGRFTLRYEPANTMNPILALNRDNITLTSLLYESLFVLDANLMPIPILCSEWETEDSITFRLEILPDVMMHDGSLLTAEDVAYSLRQARGRGRHRSKLRNANSISHEGETTVVIVLDEPNARFIRLLDIPIIRRDSIEERIPPGTGPYIFPDPEGLRLTRFINHRDSLNMPLTTIFLRQAPDSELTSLFDEGVLSMLWDDPAGAFDIRINRHHEPRYYNTTTLQFLGFNATSNVLRHYDVRRAIGHAVERQFIVDNIMNVPRSGQTVASPLAISPVFDMYDPSWEPHTDPLREMGELLDRSGFVDYDSCGFLEAPDGMGGFVKFSLTFLVNIENAHKIRAAERIAQNLMQAGLDVTVRAVPWSNFIDALENGRFDIYYGEVQIGADFDLSPLLLPGDNYLNYGRTGSTSYAPFIRSFLAANTEEDMLFAGRALCDQIRVNAPFIPILYKRHAIYTPMGVVSGATPGQSGVFSNFQNWSVDLDVLN